MGYKDISKTIDERVRDLLALLTLEEKIGFLPSDQQPVERLGIVHREIGTEYAREPCLLLRQK